MAIGAHSYGSTAAIAGMAPRFANRSGEFDATTRPTLAQVEGYVDQVSGVVNTILAAGGFSAPISQSDVKLALDLFVNAEVVSIVEGVNGLGRFGPSVKQPGSRGWSSLIMDDVKGFIEGHVLGIERLGVARTTGRATSQRVMRQDAYSDDLDNSESDLL
jgi:hypothetical protein